MVEIKAPEAADLVARILQERFEPSSWQDPSGAPALVLSFHEEPLRRTREAAAAPPPHAPAAAAVAPRPEAPPPARGAVRRRPGGGHRGAAAGRPPPGRRGGGWDARLPSTPRDRSPVGDKSRSELVNIY